MFPHELIVFRHGETEWNRDGRLQGRLDSTLTDKGEEQARAIGHYLAHLGVSEDSHDILVSPQARVVKTAELALPSGRGAWRSLDDLREIDVGDWTGLTVEEIAEKWPGTELENALDLYLLAPGGETFDALWNRVGRVLKVVSRPTIIVTHGMTSRFLRTRAMGYDLDRLEDLSGGQGVIHRIRNGRHESLVPTDA